MMRCLVLTLVTLAMIHDHVAIALETGHSGKMEDQEIDHKEGEASHKLRERRSTDSRGHILFFVHAAKPSRKSSWTNVYNRIKRSASPPPMRQLHITTQVAARYGQTQIQSVMENTDDIDKETVFQVQLPEAAFISNFSMIIDGELYIGSVMEKAEAEKAYEEAREKAQSAGLVVAEDQPVMPRQARNMQKFSVTVNVAAGSSADFTLSYMELIRRTLGVYQHIISVRPNQLVEDLCILTSLYEPQGFTMFTIKEPGNSLDTIDTELTESDATIRKLRYCPSIRRQTELGSINGIESDYKILYDITHHEDAGHIEQENGYFVHYFSPSGNSLTPLRKNIMFVIDVSGSMSGDKIEQSKEALVTIIAQLHPDDMFGLVTFCNVVKSWKDELVPASEPYIQQAEEFVRNSLKANGGTNINEGLVRACSQLPESAEFGQNMIIFLTDGNPTAGVTSPNEIVSNIKKATNERVSVFSIGFGFDLNYDLIKQIAYTTGGFVKSIYPGSDASEQLFDFYMELNSPLIFDVRLIYPDTVVDVSTVTKHTFPQYFNGSEIVVAGKLRDVSSEEPWDMQVHGKAVTDVEWTKTVRPTGIIPEIAKDFYPEGFTEKLWAYQFITYLLQQRLMAPTELVASQFYDEALMMALKYNLVTPITSMVVTQQMRYESQAQLSSENVGMHVLAAGVETFTLSILVAIGFLSFILIIVATSLLCYYTRRRSHLQELSASLSATKSSD